MTCLTFVSFLLALSTVVPARAGTVSESFTASTSIDSAGGMVWNLGRGELHPPLFVDNWDRGFGNEDTSFSIGDGHDGAFVLSRYPLFDSDGVISGNVIEIDTDFYTELHFTEFTLDTGYTIRPVGSRPLVVYVQGETSIAGTIDCSGEDGLDGVTSLASVRGGGAGRCGGGDGGASVAPATVPSAVHAGGDGGAGVTGGQGGPICLATGGQGGGGGGGFVKAFAIAGDKPDPTDGDDSTGGAGGAVGAINRDDAFVADVDGAGAGGGGGSAYDNGADPANHSSGAGGGGGGGNVRFYTGGNVVITATGAIRADGGSGGSLAGTLKGGGGGGGGGGSVLIFAAQDVTLDGPVTATAGAVGVSGGGDGGAGAWGRTWIVGRAGYAGGTTLEDPESQLDVPGDVRYETGVTYTATSTAIDLLNTKPTILALPMTVVDQGGSAITYEVSFSALPDLSTFDAFASSAGFVGSEVKRYFRFRIQVDNTDDQTPVRIQHLSVNFDGFMQDEFAFATGCGSVSRFNASNTPSGWAALAFLLLFILPVLVRGLLLRW